MRQFLLAFALIMVVCGLQPALAQNKPSLLQETIANLNKQVCNPSLPTATLKKCHEEFINFSVNALLLAIATTGVETAKIAGDAAAADRFSAQAKSALEVLSAVEARTKHYKALEQHR